MPALELKPEGLFCPSGQFYVDPWRPVGTAIITHAHADHARPGHGTYYASAESLPILRHRLGNIAVTGWNYGQPQKLGNAWVSLHPAGHILGSAQVRIESAGEVVVVTGDFKRANDPTCRPFEPVEGDVLITEATFSLPVYHWSPVAEVIQDIFLWWQECRASNATAILCCYALGKAQRVLAELQRFTEDRVLVHGAVEQITDLYRAQGVAMLPTELVTDVQNFAGEMVIAPPSAAGSAWMKRFQRVEVGFCSGWMQIRGNRRRRGVARGFVLSDHADWPALLTTIAESKARQVLLTHGRTDVIVRYLQENGVAAEALVTAYGEEAD